MGSIIHYKMLYIYIYIKEPGSPTDPYHSHPVPLLLGMWLWHLPWFRCFHVRCTGCLRLKVKLRGAEGKKTLGSVGMYTVGPPRHGPPEAWPFGVILYFWSKNICSTGGWLDVGRYFENFRISAHDFFWLISSETSTDGCWASTFLICG